ncbi:hemolysin family protein [Acidobacteriota bacterium]
MEEILNQLSQFWEGFKVFLSNPPRLFQLDMLLRLVLQVILFCGSSFFSGSETALFSLSRLDLQKLRRERNPKSGTLHALLDHPRRLIISILCGNELVNIAAAANMTGIIVSLYGVERATWISIFVMVPLILLFGEVTPKTIAVSNPVQISTRVVASPMSKWVRIIAPLAWLVRKIADKITFAIVGEEKTPDNILQVDEFRTLVEQGVLAGELTATERALINNLLKAGSTEIVEIMIPRTRVKFINGDLSVPDMIEKFIAFQHQRIPVYREHRDNIMGFIHVEDIQRLILDKVDLSSMEPEAIVRPPVMIPLTKDVDEMLDFFQTQNVQAAMVLNEFGGVDGLVTMKDVINFVFGQENVRMNSDEVYHDKNTGCFEVPGKMKLKDLNDITNLGIDDVRMTTIGGIVLRHLDRLPRAGDEVLLDGVVIKVLEMDQHRVARVSIAKGASSTEDPSEYNRTEISCKSSKQDHYEADKNSFRSGKEIKE